MVEAVRKRIACRRRGPKKSTGLSCELLEQSRMSKELRHSLSMPIRGVCRGAPILDKRFRAEASAFLSSCHEMARLACLKE